MTAGMTAALFTGVPLGSWIGGALGWRATFRLIAAVGAVAAIGVSASVPETGGSEPAPLRQQLAPLRDPRVLRLVGVTFLAASGGLMFYSYRATYVAEVGPDSYTLLSFLLFVVGVADLAGALLAGRVTDRWGPRRGLRLVLGGHALALAAAALLVLGGVHDVVALTLVITCWSVFAWGLNPPVQGSILAATAPGRA